VIIQIEIPEKQDTGEIKLCDKYGYAPIEKLLINAESINKSKYLENNLNVKNLL
tara:strand:- start:858 stop:1019 length:162 start_codon:yes stop_codon:yes gene_type:complete